jgi:sortase (surface protein transpeptidase)
MNHAVSRAPTKPDGVSILTSGWKLGSAPENGSRAGRALSLAVTVLVAALMSAPAVAITQGADMARAGAILDLTRLTPASRAPRLPAPPSRLAKPATTGAVPLRLQIPSIGVDAVVERVGVTPEGNLGVPENVDDVAWYRDGPAPGAAGDAVIDGHLDWFTGPAVFQGLSRLRAGDLEMVSTGSGQRLTFKVSRVYTVSFESSPPGLFDRAGPPRMSLLTCAGPWDPVHETYASRLIVEAAEVRTAGTAP